MGRGGASSPESDLALDGEGFRDADQQNQHLLFLLVGQPEYGGGVQGIGRPHIIYLETNHVCSLSIGPGSAWFLSRATTCEMTGLRRLKGVSPPVDTIVIVVEVLVYGYNKPGAQKQVKTK